MGNELVKMVGVAEALVDVEEQGWNLYLWQRKGGQWVTFFVKKSFYRPL